MNEVREKFTEASPHFLAVYGNHDDNHLDGGIVFTQDVFYPLMQKHAADYVEYEAPCYYYMDSEATRTRPHGKCRRSWSMSVTCLMR